jgi:hypothetical protein
MADTPEIFQPLCTIDLDVQNKTFCALQPALEADLLFASLHGYQLLAGLAVRRSIPRQTRGQQSPSLSSDVSSGLQQRRETQGSLPNVCFRIAAISPRQLSRSPYRSQALRETQMSVSIHQWRRLAGRTRPVRFPKTSRQPRYSLVEIPDVLTSGCSARSTVQVARRSQPQNRNHVILPIH